MLPDPGVQHYRLSALSLNPKPLHPVRAPDVALATVVELRKSAQGLELQYSGLDN